MFSCHKGHKYVDYIFMEIMKPRQKASFIELLPALNRNVESKLIIIFIVY